MKLKNNLFTAAIAAPLLAMSSYTLADIKNIDVDALLEIESASSEFDNESDTNALSVGAMELTFSGNINENASMVVQFLHEDDGTPLELDVATIRVKAFENADIIAGKMYVPFGAFETGHISDPLTLELGEVRENAVSLNYSNASFVADAYAFSRLEGTEGNDYGIKLGFESENASTAFNISYITSLLIDGLMPDELVSLAAIGAFGQLELGKVQLMAELVAATETYVSDAVEYQPSTFSLEAIYNFNNESTLAFGYQESEEVISLEIPTTRTLLTYSFAPIYDSVGFKVEYAHDTVEVSDDEELSGDTLTLQLSIEM